MRIEAGQKLIDKIRGKKTDCNTVSISCQQNKPNVSADMKSNSLNDTFEARVKFFLRQIAPYHYPETKNDYMPDYSKKVQIEINSNVAERDYDRAVQYLNQLDIKALNETYENLADEYSKEMMLRIIAYRAYEDSRLRFPLFYDKCFEEYNKIENSVTDNEVISVWNDLIRLKKYDMRKFGYDLQLWQNPMGIMVEFIEQQYQYKNKIKVEEGDCVIDGGGCWGDTALYFSNKNKGKGKVYSFEFMPENVGIFGKNMDLNPQYKNNVELIQHPLSDVSGKKLYAVPNGPGTCVTGVKQDNAIEFSTITIDDFVEQNKIEKIDYIKLDVEGSEEATLKGAIKTIRKFKPKLAVCVYHKKDDLCVLPKIIKELVPEYKLYLDHFTINFTESVMFAQV